MDCNTVRRKSLLFARRIVFASRHLRDIKGEYILTKQLVRSGTSIGANIAEAQYGSSRKDFLNKLYIAQPGGSIRDDLVIEECNKNGIAMAFTGMRLFHH